VQDAGARSREDRVHPRAPEIVAFAFGEKWMPVVPVLRILAAAGIIDSMASFRGDILSAMGKPSRRLWQSGLSCLLYLVGFWIAYRYGIVAIAWAYLLRRAIVFPIGQWTVRRLIGFSWRVYGQGLVVPLLAGAAMLGAMVWIKAWMGSSAPLAGVIFVSAFFGFSVFAGAVHLSAPEIFREGRLLFEQATRGEDRRTEGASS